MSIEELKGKIITKITTRARGHADEIVFQTTDKIYKMHHHQDCCESVTIDSIVGDLDDLLNTEILLAEERSSNNRKRIVPDEILRQAKGYEDDSFTWTFYTIRTNKGTVDIRWYGGSNGYYSEEVTVEEIET
jgi:hypothetical protein